MIGTAWKVLLLLGIYLMVSPRHPRGHAFRYQILVTEAMLLDSRGSQRF